MLLRGLRKSVERIFWRATRLRLIEPGEAGDSGRPSRTIGSCRARTRSYVRAVIYL